MKKCYTLDLAKFAFTLMIAVYHLWTHYRMPGRGGYIAVEFFFVLSGYLLAMKADLSGEQTVMQYTWSRIKKFYPHYLFSFLVLFFLEEFV